MPTGIYNRKKRSRIKSVSTVFVTRLNGVAAVAKDAPATLISTSALEALLGHAISEQHPTRISIRTKTM